MKLYDAVSEAASLCIADALRQTNGSFKEAAKLLGVNRQHLYRLTKRIVERPSKWRPPLKVIPELANWRRA